MKNILNQYPIIYKVLSILAFLYVIFGSYNEMMFHYVDSVFFSHYSEGIAIFVFYLLNIFYISETERYIRVRQSVMVFATLVIYYLIPYFFPFLVPKIGFSPFETGFPATHIPGTATFFILLVLVLLFGRRFDCSWCCPCVGIRETVGLVFRNNTKKGKFWWKLRHIKWFFLGLTIIYFILIFMPLSNERLYFILFYWHTIFGLYYFSFIIIPFTGNRNYCRYICPWGTIYGLLNKFGFYKVKGYRELCNECGTCELECDMGVPVMKLLKENNEINTIDCTGCGRCVYNCVNDCLKFESIYTRILKK